MVPVVLPTLLGSGHRLTPELIGKPAAGLSLCHHQRLHVRTDGCIVSIHPTQMRPYACQTQRHPFAII